MRSVELFNSVNNKLTTVDPPIFRPLIDNDNNKMSELVIIVLLDSASILCDLNRVHLA